MLLRDEEDEDRLSASGHSRRFWSICDMSAIRPISDDRFDVADLAIGMMALWVG
jgi:hypothetical protein